VQVRVELFVEQMYSETRQLAVTGLFTFVAVDEHRRPVSVRSNLPVPTVAE
jgi:acyl-CoA hydrolase